MSASSGVLRRFGDVLCLLRQGAKGAAPHLHDAVEVALKVLVELLHPRTPRHLLELDLASLQHPLHVGVKLAAVIRGDLVHFAAEHVGHHVEHLLQLGGDHVRLLAVNLSNEPVAGEHVAQGDPVPGVVEPEVFLQVDAFPLDEINLAVAALLHVDAPLLLLVRHVLAHLQDALGREELVAVSYTHLTLPTSDLV